MKGGDVDPFRTFCRRKGEEREGDDIGFGGVDASPGAVGDQRFSAVAEGQG